jgi:hypothetical protein
MKPAKAAIRKLESWSVGCQHLPECDRAAKRSSNQKRREKPSGIAEKLKRACECKAPKMPEGLRRGGTVHSKFKGATMTQTDAQSITESMPTSAEFRANFDRKSLVVGRPT